MSDDTQLPTQVAIERVCDGRPHREAWVDGTGRFSFEVGRDESVMMDASADNEADFGNGPPISSHSMLGRIIAASPPGTAAGDFPTNMQRNAVSNCELRAAAPGFRSSTINLAGHQPLDSPEVGVIVLQRLERVEGTVTSAVTARAPQDAKKSFERGQEFIKKSKVEDAEREFEKAVAIYPQHAAAWVELGRLRLQRNAAGPARQAFQKALDADPKFVSPYLDLAFVSAMEMKWPEVLTLTDKAVSLDPLDFPIAFFFQGLAHLNLGHLDEAEKSARQAERLDSAHRLPRISLLLGGVLGQKRDFMGAAEQYRHYLKLAPQANDADKVRSQLADVEKQLAAGPGSNR